MTWEQRLMWVATMVFGHGYAWLMIMMHVLHRI
jgi:hypothetical protein